MLTLRNLFHRFTPDLCSYATMLSAYVNASDMEGAEKFFRRLKEDGLKPNVIVYGTLMKGYAKENNLEKVMRVYERMRMQGIEANQAIFTTIMDAHGKNSNFESAITWFKEMIARGFPPDQKAKNVLLSLAKTPEEQKEANELAGNVNGLSDLDGDGKNAGCRTSKLQNGSDLSKKYVSKVSNLNVDDEVESDDDEVDLDSEESQELTFVEPL